MKGPEFVTAPMVTESWLESTSAARLSECNGGRVRTDRGACLAHLVNVSGAAAPIDVPDMEIAVDPGKTYAFEALISVQYPIGDPTTNAVISFDIPAGADLHYYRVDLTDNNAAARGNKTEAAETFDAPEEPGENHFLLHGFVRTNGTGGTVQMQLATSTAGRTIRLTENSYMKIVTN